MACPTGIIQACDFPQFLVDQTPKFDEIIMEDIRPTDGWLYNVSTGTTPMGTPVEITQDRFRAVFPNTTKVWTRVVANGPGCTGNPCDPREHTIGQGADRLTYFAEEQTWSTNLFCYNQEMHITAAMQHLDQVISDILRPATTFISSNFLRKRHLVWSKKKNVANGNVARDGTDGVFTFAWKSQTGAVPDGTPGNDEEIFFDCSVNPNRVFKLVPQMLQNRFNNLMLQGYAGKNPFKETSPFIEIVLDMDTIWNLDHLGGQQGVGGANNPSVLGNWRFEDFNASSKYWRYGFSGQIGNFMARNDPMGLRFNFVADLGAGAAPNRFRYQVVLPYENVITTGAGGAAGLGSIPNPDFDTAQFALGQIHHKMGMELLVPDAKPINPEMPFGHRDFGGKWKWMMHDLGADINGTPISNKWENKGQFGAWFKYYIRPLHYEFMETFFYKREQFCVPEIGTCNTSPGYPAQSYNSSPPNCPLPSAFGAIYGTAPFSTTGASVAPGAGVPTGNADGQVPNQSNPPASSVPDN